MVNDGSLTQEVANFDVLSKLFEGGQVRISDIGSHVVDKRKTVRRRTHGPRRKIGIQKTLEGMQREIMEETKMISYDRNMKQAQQGERRGGGGGGGGEEG